MIKFQWSYLTQFYFNKEFSAVILDFGCRCELSLMSHMFCELLYKLCVLVSEGSENKNNIFRHKTNSKMSEWAYLCLRRKIVLRTIFGEGFIESAEYWSFLKLLMLTKTTFVAIGIDFINKTNFSIRYIPISRKISTFFKSFSNALCSTSEAYRLIYL